MGVDHIRGAEGMRQEIQRLWRELRRVAKATLQNGAIGRAGIRVYDGGWIRIEGGGLSVTGTQTVSGTLTGTGTFDWSGPMNLTGNQTVTGDVTYTGQLTVNGPWDLNGNGDITGNVGISGDLTLNSDLTLGSGRIVAGPVTIDKLGPAGGRIASSGQMIVDGDTVYLGASTTVEGPLGVTGHIQAQSLDVGPGSKNFRIEHPLKPGVWLRHGSTESPVSGTEYTGRATIGAGGSVVIELPDYFEALNKSRNRTVQLTPIGAPFAVGADDVAGGKFTAYGEPGREVFWLVKAERISGEFPLEEPIAED